MKIKSNKRRLFDLRKYYIVIISLIFVFAVVLPLPAFLRKERVVTASAKNYSGDTVKVLFSNGDCEEIARYDFIFGILCNLDPKYDEEAYKAQALASASLIQYELDFDTEKLDIADFSQKSVFFQNYLTEEQQRERLKDDFEDTSKKINTALSAVYDRLIVFDGRPILALSHNLSAGKTESSEIIFGKKLDYLIPAQSASDLLSPNYQQSLSFEAEEIAEKLSKLDIEFKGEKSEWFSNPDNSDSGTVTLIKICGKAVKGVEVMKALQLPSAVFDVEYKDEKFTFLCRGEGSGVGLSRFGANYMAEHGCTYEEIIKWYYKGVTVEKI